MSTGQETQPTFQEVLMMEGLEQLRLHTSLLLDLKILLSSTSGSGPGSLTEKQRWTQSLERFFGTVKRSELIARAMEGDMETDPLTALFEVMKEALYAFES